MKAKRRRRATTSCRPARLRLSNAGQNLTTGQGTNMRIAATLGGIEQRLLTQLARSEAAAAANAFRLATGKRINSPADDPSGFLYVRSLEQQKARANDALSQVQAASNIASQSQVTIDLIRTELNTIRQTLLTDETQTLTAAQRDAAQATIDAAINQVHKLAGTDIDGQRVLDGSADFSATGLSHTQVEDLQVFDVNGTTITATVATTAQQATLTHTGSSGDFFSDRRPWLDNPLGYRRPVADFRTRCHQSGESQDGRYR